MLSNRFIAKATRFLCNVSMSYMDREITSRMAANRLTISMERSSSAAMRRVSHEVEKWLEENTSGYIFFEVYDDAIVVWFSEEADMVATVLRFNQSDIPD
jgi:hypothetical protein